MTTLTTRILDEDEGDEMARARPDLALVARYTEMFVRAGADRASFDEAYSEFVADKSVKSADAIEIAHAFAKGRKARSKTDALTAIRKRAVELRQIATLNRNAEKARPW